MQKSIREAAKRNDMTSAKASRRITGLHCTYIIRLRLLAYKKCGRAFPRLIAFYKLKAQLENFLVGYQRSLCSQLASSFHIWFLDSRALPGKLLPLGIVARLRTKIVAQLVTTWSKHFLQSSGPRPSCLKNLCFEPSKAWRISPGDYAVAANRRRTSSIIESCSPWAIELEHYCSCGPS